MTNSAIITPDQVMEKEIMREMRATVVELGEDAYKGVSPRCKPGDKVMISKFSGVLVIGPADGKLYRLCNAEDVFCRIKGDMTNVLIKNPIMASKQAGGESAQQARILQARA